MIEISDLTVSPAHIDGYGHVNNAVYLSFLQSAVAGVLGQAGYSEDWRLDSLFSWCLQNISIEYRQPAFCGDVLQVSLCLESGNELEIVLLAEITKRNSDLDNAGIVRARIRWQRFDRQTRLPVQIQATALEKLSGELIPTLTPPRNFDLPADNPQARQFCWSHIVKIYEVGPDRHAQPEAIFHWLETAVFDSFDQAGWQLERRLSHNFLVLQSRHDAQLFLLPKNGDRIIAVSRLVEVKRLRGSWMVDLYVENSDGKQELAIRDISTGVFLNAHGKPASPPAIILEELLQH